jgi:peroxiredoxin
MSRGLRAVLLALLALVTCGATPGRAPLPTLSARDVDQRLHALPNALGRPTALLFFCGCSRCGPAARLWSRTPHSGTADTLVVFAGDAEQTRRFAAVHRLTGTLIPDPDLRLARAFHAIPCPRVFVVDASGALRYTNDAPDDRPESEAPGRMVARAVAALRGGPGAGPAARVEAEPDPSMDTPRLTVVAGGEIEATGPGKGRWQFGEVDALTTARRTTVLTLRNGGPAPVEIGALETSCGCTGAALTHTGRNARLMKPGGSVGIRVSLNLWGTTPGGVDKYVWIYARGQRGPSATLELTGILHPNVLFFPPSAEFGAGPGGRPRTTYVVPVVDSRLFQGQIPRLVSTNPDVRVSRSHAERHPLFNHPEQILPRRATTLGEFTLTLSPRACLGPLSGELRFESGWTRGRPAMIRRAAREAAVSIGGEVTGEARAAPQSVLFEEPIRPGQRTMRRVTVTAASIASVSSESRWVAARLLPSAGGAARTLEITVRPGAPSGPLDTRVIVAPDGGRRLAVPVFALVSGGGARRRSHRNAGG